MSKARVEIKELQIRLNIKENKCISFSLTDYANSNKEKIPFDNYEFNIKSDYSLLQDEKSFRVILTIKLRDKESSNKPELAEIVVFNRFEVKNYDDIIKKVNNETTMPRQLVGVCSELALSCARGMLTLKLEDTPYSEAIIPLLNREQLSPKNELPK